MIKKLFTIMVFTRLTFSLKGAFLILIVFFIEIP